MNDEYNSNSTYYTVGSLSPEIALLVATKGIGTAVKKGIKTTGKVIKIVSKPPKKLNGGKTIEGFDDKILKGVGGQSSGKPKVEVDERKFSEYALDPNNSNGKSEIFKSYGYNQSNSAELAKSYQTQAQQKYAAGDYVLDKSDQYGQRITINVTISNGGNTTVVQSGWMINADGSLRLVTPFAGFVK